MNKENIKVGITIGDINGIGLEVILKSLSDSRILSNITPIIYGSSKIINYYKKCINVSSIHFNLIQNVSSAIKHKCNVINISNEDINIEPGKPSCLSGALSYTSLKKATDDLANSNIDVIITAPINKKKIQNKEFEFKGHTEFLTKLSNEEESLMLMCYNQLRVGLVTNHLSISEVNNNINSELIVKKLTLLNNSLIKDFKILKPKIAVLGLNPHCGDNGLIGKEEQEQITPAINKANENNILTFGPFPADGFFGSKSYLQYDAVLAMYHDQGLIPFKTIAQGNGVNFTAGLPIIRTSPDHGTAYDIAGKNKASADSMRNAIYLAIDIYRNRKLYKRINSDTLQKQKL